MKEATLNSAAIKIAIVMACPSFVWQSWRAPRVFLASAEPKLLPRHLKVAAEVGVRAKTSGRAALPSLLAEGWGCELLGRGAAVVRGR
jgi:hypothetical protein